MCFTHHCLQAALRKAQNRCKTLEGELSSSKAQQQQQVEPTPPEQQQQPGSSAEQQDAASAELQAECMSLAGQLEEARRMQREAEALAAKCQEQCAQLEQQVVQLQQQAAGPAEAACPADDVAVEHTAEEQAAVKGEAAASPSAATLQQQLAEKAAQLEQLEFERHELAVKLEESERRVAALTSQAAAAKQQQQQPSGADEASDKLPAGRSHDTDGSEQSWSLAAGEADASGSQVAAEALVAARQEAGALKQQVQQLEGQVAALQAELAAAQAGAGGSAVADVAAAELRRQLQERTQEVADLSALSIKADATVQQYMAQLRRWVFCSSWRQPAVREASLAAKLSSGHVLPVWLSLAHRFLTFTVLVPTAPCSMTTELRAVQLRLGDAETQLARRVEEAQVRFR